MNMNIYFAFVGLHTLMSDNN